MTVKELIEVLVSLPEDYEVTASCGPVVCVWESNDDSQIELDYGNTWHTITDPNPSFRKVFDAEPGKQNFG